MKNGHESLLPGELTMLKSTDREVQRGRDVAKRIRDTVLNWEARGRAVVEVRVSEHTANLLVTYFRSWARVIGNTYPTRVEGVPLLVVPGQTEDVEFVLAAEAH
jgi:hypothetical protein